MIFGKSHLRIANHIFKIEGIKTVSLNHNPIPPAMYQVGINYECGTVVYIAIEDKAQAEEAMAQIGKALRI